jgi:endonuclease/exonuclease/phosphatase family metal-dependent hydrolase
VSAPDTEPAERDAAAEKVDGFVPLRVLTWNVRDLLGDPLAVARVIRSADADLVCLQEGPRWPGSRWRLAALARGSGMLFVDGGRSAAGCALLASLRTDVRSVLTTRLPVEGRRQRPRGAVLAEVAPVGCLGVALGVVHLGLSAPERLRHVRIVGEVLAALGPERVLVAGDLNEAPGGAAWTAWQPLCTDPLAVSASSGTPGRGAGVNSGRSPGEPTFSVRRPRRRIDAVLVGGLRVVEYDAWRADGDDVAAASDHRPVLAVVEVPRR